jgi:predicted transposase YbfD/YdcC
MRYRSESLDTLAAIFSSITDTRDNRGKRHRLIDIFILAVIGLLWGHTDFTNMVRELKYHEDYLTELLGCEHGIPSHNTFSATFAIIDPAEFTECFMQWVVEIGRAKGAQVAIDGKAVRAAAEKVYHKKAPVMVNALLVKSGVCIGQMRVEDKTNEIKGIPDLLDWLDIEGATITADAIACQREIVDKIVSKKADFVLPVKGNQPTMHDDITLEMQRVISEQRFEEALTDSLASRGVTTKTPFSDKLKTFQELDKGHGRIERRTYYVWNDPSCILKQGWQAVAGVGMVLRERWQIHRGEDGEALREESTTETESYILSRHMEADEFGCYARGHWAVENSLHWVLDDALREDRCTARRGHATENLALMRKIVYNMMKLDDAVAGMSVRAKQVFYRNNPDAAARLIFEVVPGSKA